MSIKAQIRAEIERLKNHSLIMGDNAINSSMRRFYEGAEDSCNSLLSFLDTLPEQPASEGLEEEIERFYRTDEYRIADTLGRGFETLARHFAEWGVKHLKK